MALPAALSALRHKNFRLYWVGQAISLTGTWMQAMAQGLVVTEALAAGVPLVSVEAMGPASTMKGERGCLFADNDAGAFATATQRLLHDQVLYERKKREALLIARASSIEKRTDELLAVYERVLNAGVSP